MPPGVLDVIGGTPLARLRGRPGGGELHGKLELLNPFGMKDRVAKHILLEARRRRLLAEGAPVVESSSGTLALGLALVGGALGHPVHIVTDPRIDPITSAKLLALGCRITVVERMTSRGWQSARLERLRAILDEHPGAFWPRQYENPENPAAYAELADELLRELGRVDVLVGPVGSGGSLCGTARRLRMANPGLRVVAVDAVGSAIFGQPDRPGRLQSGLGNSMVPRNVDLGEIDEVHWLNDGEAFAATLELARNEQLFAGSSSGSTYAVARWLACRSPAGTRVVAILPDRGDRYAATLYSPEYRQEKGVEGTELPEEPVRVPYGTAVERWSWSPVERSR
jgi:cysteine synthase A